jgi:aquaporin Z
MESFKKYLAELIGTMVLVLFGCGAAAFSSILELGQLGIAFSFGLVIVAMAYAIGPISGCHINPAVSIAMLINKRIGVLDFFCYIVSQFLGALAGAALIKAIFHFMGQDATNLGQNGFSKLSAANINATGAFIVEVILTFVFVLTVMGVTGKKGNSSLAGLIIGLALVLVHILGIPLTGTSVNPARSFGPAILVGGEALNQLWLFIVAPLVGGIIAALVAKYILNSEKEAK